MNEDFHSAVRRFVKPEHLKNVLEGKWIPLFDEYGEQLQGIAGRIGAAGNSDLGHEIGADLIKMECESAFPLHTHPGDHILYIHEGIGSVHIGGRDHLVRAGDTIYIPADLPHGVSGPKAGQPPLIFLAFGYPHKHLSSRDRMKYAGEP